MVWDAAAFSASSRLFDLNGETNTARQRQNAVDQSHAAFDQESMGQKENYSTQVWGLVYSLQPGDEASLDRSEGVPLAYTKETLGCDFWPAVNGDQDGSSKPVNVTGDEPEERDMMVYINRNAVTPSKPKEEDVDRMNMGIRDAVAAGVPEEYVKEVMRKFIPESKDEE